MGIKIRNVYLVFISFQSVSTSKTICTGYLCHPTMDNSVDVHFNLPFFEDLMQPCFRFQENEEELSCIPSLISPGVQKCGTTYLYFGLTNHPKISESSIKENNFYIHGNSDGKFKSGIEVYSSAFVHDPNQIIVDFSPKYMMVPESAEFIYQTNRNAKFIIILRDPVDRTYSHYRYQESLYYKSRNINSTLESDCPDRHNVTFKQYIQEEYELLNTCNLLTFEHSPVSYKIIYKYTIYSL